MVDQSPVEEGSIGDSSPGDLALLRFAFDICESVVLGLEDCLTLSRFIIQIA